MLIIMDRDGIAHSRVQETGDEFLNFHFIRNWSPSQKDHIKIRQFTKFEVTSLDCNQVEGFQKLEKIRDICMEIGRPSTSHSLVTR